MSRARQHRREVPHGGALLAVQDTPGEAPPVVLLTGLGTTQRVWKPVVDRLGGRHRVITFDYRGHGRSCAAPSYSFDDLLGDLHAVLEDCAVVRPLLCGWSLGADLAVWYAAEHPGAVAGVVALDGAIPADPLPNAPGRPRPRVVEPVVRLLERLMAALAGVRLDPDELAALVEGTERRRAGILSAHLALTVPVSLGLASRPTASPDGARSDALWRAGAERLTTSKPSVALTWLDSDHAIPLRVPDDVAGLIGALAAQTREPAR